MCRLRSHSLCLFSSSDLPGGGASVVVAADLFPESAGGRDRCPAKGTTGSRDLSPDQGVAPDLMNGNELRCREERRDGNLGMLKNFEKNGVPHVFFCFVGVFFFIIDIILAVLFSSVAAVVRVCSFNATAFHLTLLRLLLFLSGGDWSCCAELDRVCVLCDQRGEAL